MVSFGLVMTIVYGAVTGFIGGVLFTVWRNQNPLDLRNIRLGYDRRNLIWLSAIYGGLAGFLLYLLWNWLFLVFLGGGLFTQPFDLKAWGILGYALGAPMIGAMLIAADLSRRYEQELRKEAEL